RELSAVQLMIEALRLRLQRACATTRTRPSANPTVVAGSGVATRARMFALSGAKSEIARSPVTTAVLGHKLNPHSVTGLAPEGTVNEASGTSTIRVVSSSTLTSAPALGGVPPTRTTST